MVVTCDSVSVKQGGKLLVEHLDIFSLLSLFKVHSVRFKVFPPLSKVRNKATLPRPGLVMPRSGTSLIPSNTIGSHRQESRRSSREDCR